MYSRESQIKYAAKDAYPKIEMAGSTSLQSLLRKAFERGAAWADANPDPYRRKESDIKPEAKNE